MNNRNCGTGTEQFVCCVHMVKWPTVDYQLWYSLVIKK
jgi:hypothetical protein